jgi:hypothetical protein
MLPSRLPRCRGRHAVAGPEVARAAAGGCVLRVIGAGGGACVCYCTAAAADSTAAGVCCVQPACQRCSRASFCVSWGSRACGVCPCRVRVMRECARVGGCVSVCSRPCWRHPSLDAAHPSMFRLASCHVRGGPHMCCLAPPAAGGAACDDRPHLVQCGTPTAAGQVFTWQQQCCHCIDMWWRARCLLRTCPSAAGQRPAHLAHTWFAVTWGGMADGWRRGLCACGARAPHMHSSSVVRSWLQQWML